jgi:hypothetical protein
VLEVAGDRDNRQVGGLASGTGSTAAAAQIGAPAGRLPASCGPPRADAHGAGYADGHADSNPQEQEQEKAEEQSARNRSATPRENKIGKIGSGQEAQAREGESKTRSTGTRQSVDTSESTGTDQSLQIADLPTEPTEPTGADPMAAASQGGSEHEIEIECVDAPAPSGIARTPTPAAADPLAQAVYVRLYPTAQFESVESIKARDGRGLSMRQFRATEQGAIASGINTAIAGKSEAQRCALWAWCISAAEDVYRRDHRKRRVKPLASVWLWRLKRHSGGAGCGMAGNSGPP